MNVAVLGTGGVGRTLAAATAAAGNDVVIGTRDVDALFARQGDDPFRVWADAHADVAAATFADAAQAGELVFNATAGTGSLAALELAGASQPP